MATNSADKQNQIIDVHITCPFPGMANQRGSSTIGKGPTTEAHPNNLYLLPSNTFPTPTFGFAVTPEHRGDEQKLSDALHKLEAEDPTLIIEHRVSLNKIATLGQSDQHL